LAAGITRANGTALAAPADVGDRQQVLAAIRKVAEQLGPVDLLVANAGMGVPTTLDPFNVPEIETIFRVNTLGTIYAIEAVLPDMMHRGHGHLVAVSSLAARKGLPGKSAYCASKAALNTFMEALRIQLRHSGIAVTTICPGFVRTSMTSENQFHMPWLLEPEEAARRIVAALDRRVKVFNFPWQMALVAKVAALFPDWLIARLMPK
jgi:short-subunit dehydrogenase